MTALSDPIELIESTDGITAEGLAAPPAEQAETPAEQHTARTGWLPLVYEVLETVALAVVIWLAVNFATARFIVEGSSMEPNFHTGQMLIVSRLVYMFGSPQRGDVIVFQFPGNLTDDYIKRIIGVPGDTVVIENGKVSVNGAPLNEPYIAKDSGLTPFKGRWVVPADSYFMMGDNRGHSSDSRSWGLLPKKDIIGKAWVSYWPPAFWGIIKHYRFKGIP